MGQFTNTTIGTESMADAQHDGLLCQRTTVCAAIAACIATKGTDVFVAVLLQPLHSGCIVLAAVGTVTQIAKYGSGFHRSQLIFISDQNKPSVRTQGVKQTGGHIQIHHRGFINHHQIRM